MKTPLTPLALAERAFKYYDRRLAVIDGDREDTYGTWSHRIFQLARALKEAGIKPGDRVATLMPNTGPHAGHVLCGPVDWSHFGAVEHSSCDR